VQAVAVQNVSTGHTYLLQGKFFMDASEMGDLLPLANVEYVTGAEAQAETGEKHAPPNPQPFNMQAFTYCFAIDYQENEDHTIEKPEQYDFWKEYQAAFWPA
ncbi:FAD-dependent oxidoreductase, partial [Bacillus altitudinis]